MPPSADDLPGRKAPGQRKRGGSGKRPGKQPGAPGAHLAWRDDPDGTVPLFPSGPCRCGRDLAGAADLGISGSRQVIEVPLAAARTVQYDSHAVACACGRDARGPAAGGCRAGRDRDLGPERPGAGGVPHGHPPCPRRAVRRHPGVPVRDPPLGRVRPRAPGPGGRGGPLREHADQGTGRHRRGRLRRRDADPGRAGAEDQEAVPAGRLHEPADLLLPRRPDAGVLRRGCVPRPVPSTAVHDRYQNYDAFAGVAHQLCCAHVLRDLEDCAESYPDAIWPGQAAGALRALIHAANAARSRGLSAAPGEAITADLRLFRSAVLVGLQEVRRVPGAKARQKPGRTLLECLHDREADILRFLSDLRIPPTSNQAERDLRPVKTQQKISGRTSARRKPPATATPSAATHPPPLSTVPTPSPRYATHSRAIPGCRPSPK